MTLARRGAAPRTAAKTKISATLWPGKRPRTRAAARLSMSPPQREHKRAAVPTASRDNLMAFTIKTAPTRDTGWLISRRTDAHRRSLDEPSALPSRTSLRRTTHAKTTRSGLMGAASIRSRMDSQLSRSGGANPTTPLSLIRSRTQAATCDSRNHS